jgi:hypothetical protein
MDEEPDLSDQYRRASPWPLFVALGLAISEVGVFLGIFTVAVFGLLLFGGSIAGILTESRYTKRPWPTLLAFGAVLAVAGALIVATQFDIATVTLDDFGQNGILARSLSLAVAGAILAVSALVGTVAEQTAA